MKDEQTLKLVGHIRGYETDLDNNIIPGTEFEDHNTIGDALKIYFAHCIAVDVNNESLDALFTSASPATNVGAAKLDGIGYAHGLASTILEACFITALNVGGDGTELYTEYYGYIEGAISMNGFLILGNTLALDGADYKFDNTYATYAINKTIAADRRYHFYWKITIG